MASGLVDTNVFINIFNGKVSVIDLIKSEQAVVSSIVHLELIQGSKNKVEVCKIEKVLSYFETLFF